MPLHPPTHASDPWVGNGDNLTALGFRAARGTIHTSQTILAANASVLVSALGCDAYAWDRAALEAKIVEENIFGKRTESARLGSVGDMIALYGFDDPPPITQAALALWRAESNHALLLGMLAVARDPVLRASGDVVFAIFGRAGCAAEGAIRLGSGPIDGFAGWAPDRLIGDVEEAPPMSGLALLSEAQMRWIRPYFPLSHGIPRVHGPQVVSGIVFVIRNGLRRRDAPSGYEVRPPPALRALDPTSPRATSSSRCQLPRRLAARDNQLPGQVRSAPRAKRRIRSRPAPGHLQPASVERCRYTGQVRSDRSVRLL